ncbi:MAG: hypothetical protein AAF495_23470 [Pseudomonadota bacterium]
MELGIYAYLVTTLLFAGGALAVELLVDFRRLWAYRRLLAVMIAVALFLTLIGESTALDWRIWVYNPARTFDIFLGGAALETYLYAVLVTLAITCAALIGARYEERGLPLAKTAYVKLRERLGRQS